MIQLIAKIIIVLFIFISILFSYCSLVVSSRCSREEEIKK